MAWRHRAAGQSLTLRLASLGSGSRGNATLLATDSTCLLVDCGFTLKDCRSRLARAGVDAATLDALLITHEHADHARGAARAARAFDIPVYGTRGTLTALTDLNPELARPITADIAFTIGDIRVLPVSVPHDAREPVQYVFESGPARLGVLTDIGHVTPHVIDAYSGCHGLFVESNHDLDMLWGGGYPRRLKRRIAGNFGHLANVQAASLIRHVLHDGLAHLVVGHVSERNNHHRHIEAAFAELRAELATFSIANQATGTEWMVIA